MKQTGQPRRNKSYCFADDMHERLQELADKRTHGNRSRMAEELIEAGILAIIHPKAVDYGPCEFSENKAGAQRCGLVSVTLYQSRGRASVALCQRHATVVIGAQATADDEQGGE